MKHSFVTLADDHRRYTWIFLIQSKTEVFHVLQTFLSLIKNQFGVSVKLFRSDNGREFVNSQCDILFKSEGIIHQTNCAYTPQQNGIVERKQKHILEVARALKFQSGIPIRFWGECVRTIVYLINEHPSLLLMKNQLMK